MSASSFRLTLAAVTSFLCGVAPLAPLPPANAGPGVWRVALRTSSGFDTLSAFPDGTGYATVAVVAAGLTEAVASDLPADDVGSYLKTTDYGATWLPMAVPPPRGWSGTANLYVRYGTPDAGYATYPLRMSLAATAGRVSRDACLRFSNTFRTTDGGLTWDPLCEPLPTPGTRMRPFFAPIAVGPGGRTVLLTGMEERGGARCEPGWRTAVAHLSTDGGESWTRAALPRGYAIPGAGARVYDRRTAVLIAHYVEYRVRTQDGITECVVQGTRAGVFLTTDGGRTYRRVFSCARQPYCTAVAFMSRNKLIVGRNDGSTMVSRDGGRTWAPGRRLYDVANDEAARSDPRHRYIHWVQSFSFPTDRVGYASTRGAGTWRTVDGGASWEQELSHECRYHQFGIGENAAFDVDRALTGGPQFISVRTPAPVSAGDCHPGSGQAPRAAVAEESGMSVLADGTLRIVERIAPPAR